MEAAFAGKTYENQDRNVTVDTQGKPFIIKQSSASGKDKTPGSVFNGNESIWNKVSSSVGNGKVRTNTYRHGAAGNETLENSSKYVIRMNRDQGSRTEEVSEPPKKRIKNIVTDLSEQNWVAAPSDWFHRLGKKIDDANGFGKYAHACIAVVPHHGGLTSNLWFDTDHPFIDSNHTNEHSHLRHESVIALYNSARPKYNYITYLPDKVSGNGSQGTHSSGGTMNTVLYNAIINGYLPMVVSTLTTWMGKEKAQQVPREIIPISKDR